LLAIFNIINDSARAYRSVIPADRWHEPYMPIDELQHEITDGVRFSGFVLRDQLVGVMGLQDKSDVSLIRHAYVRTEYRNQGIGGQLLAELRTQARSPLLVGTWAAARWAIAFYEKHNFHLLSRAASMRALRKYWSISQEQMEASVVLADSDPTRWEKESEDKA
jgi:GNAT superfamily N-acetyltransferase